MRVVVVLFLLCLAGVLLVRSRLAPRPAAGPVRAQAEGVAGARSRDAASPEPRADSRESAPPAEERQRAAVSDTDSAPRVRLQPSEGTFLVVRVVEAATNRPVPLVRIEAEPPGGASGGLIDLGRPETGPHRTGPDGVVELALPVPGRWTVRAGGADCGAVAPVPVDVAAGQRSEVVVRLLDKTRAAVRVVAGESDEPLTGARLTARLVAGAARFEVGVRRVGEGTFELVVPPCADLLLEARAPGRHRSSRVVRYPARDVELRLFRPAAVDVLAQDDAGAPVARVRVTVEPEEGAPRAAVTGPTGHARISELDGGLPLVLQVTAPGGRPLLRREGLVLAGGETRSVRVRAAAPVEWRGRARDEHGVPVAGIRLQLVATDESTGRYGAARVGEHRLETHTRADGSFAFENVDPGLWRVGPARSGQGVALYATPVSVPENEGAEIVLYRDLFVRGHVANDSGQPAPGLAVHAVPTDRGGELQTRAGADGNFALGPLVPGPLKLWAEVAPGARGPAVYVEAGAADVVLMRP